MPTKKKPTKKPREMIGFTKISAMTSHQVAELLLMAPDLPIRIDHFDPKSETRLWGFSETAKYVNFQLEWAVRGIEVKK